MFQAVLSNAFMLHVDAMNQPLVSFVIASYNYERFIGKAIQSILQQTVQDFEIIVVDDVSSDASRNVVQGFGDSRIRLYVNDHNMGPVLTYNRAVSLAKGEYISYLDADDWIEPQKIEQQQRYFRENPHVDIVGTYVKILGSDGERHSQADYFEKI